MEEKQSSSEMPQYLSPGAAMIGVPWRLRTFVPTAWHCAGQTCRSAYQRSEFKFKLVTYFPD